MPVSARPDRGCIASIETAHGRRTAPGTDQSLACQRAPPVAGSGGRERDALVGTAGRLGRSACRSGGMLFANKMGCGRQAGARGSRCFNARLSSSPTTGALAAAEMPAAEPSSSVQSTKPATLSSDVPPRGPAPSISNQSCSIRRRAVTPFAPRSEPHGVRANRVGSTLPRTGSHHARIHNYSQLRGHHLTATQHHAARLPGVHDPNPAPA